MIYVAVLLAALPQKSGKGASIMKLILAIVNNDDAYPVSTGLSREGFIATKISSTGGFLMSGNTTFLVGVEDERLENAMSIIASHCKKREQIVPQNVVKGSVASIPRGSTKVIVGGATVFVLNVEEFRHL